MPVLKGCHTHVRTLAQHSTARKLKIEIGEGGGGRLIFITLLVPVLRGC